MSAQLDLFVSPRAIKVPIPGLDLEDLMKPMPPFHGPMDILEWMFHQANEQHDYKHAYSRSCVPDSTFQRLYVQKDAAGAGHALFYVHCAVNPFTSAAGRHHGYQDRRFQ